MKKSIMMLTLMVVMITQGMAQKEKRGGEMDKEERMERYESMKVAHITNAIQLTPEEAQKFWPVYNKWNDKKRTLRESFKPTPHDEEMDEKEAQAYLDNALSHKKEMAELDEKMYKDLKGILSAEKLVKLMNSEQNFHRTVVKRFKEKHRSDRGRSEGRDRMNEGKRN